MRRVIASNMVSLDGYFEDPQRQLDWHMVDDEFFDYAAEMLRSVDTILFGRLTFEIMAAYWSSAPPDAIANRMNGIEKIVFSNTLTSANWAHSTISRGEAVEGVRRLKAFPGRDMVVLGSGALASSLLQTGLVDEYRVILNPVILGGGNPLFQCFHDRMKLKLVNLRRFHSGVVMLAFNPA